MKSKKIISGLLALSFIFGGTVLPNAAVDSTVISASAEKCGSFYYEELDDGTVKITDFDDSSTETDVIVPSELDGKTVTKIGRAFDHTNKTTSVTIPDTVYSIDEFAFYLCPKLKKVDMSKNIKKIGSHAFYGCTSLESIALPEGLQFIDMYAFDNCDSLKTVEIPASLLNIGEYAFYNCDKLENVTFAERKKWLNIDKCAFWECKSLKELDLPDSIIHLGEYAFAGCDSLKRLTLSGNPHFDNCVFANNPNLESVTIPSSIDTISTFEFGNCENLKEITIPASVTYIVDYPFSGCIDLVIKCYKDTAAHKYAIDNDIQYELLDEPKPEYPDFPKNIKVDYSEKYHQIRFEWDPVKGAEKYGIAVYLAGKWRVQTQDISADTTTFTSPKNLTPGKKYTVAIIAKVNGEWQTKYPLKNAVTVVVK